MSRGFEIERAKGDGNCLYSAIGRSAGKDQGEIRADVVRYAMDNWCELGDIGAVYSLEDFIEESSKDGAWGGKAQVVVWARASGRSVIVHSLGGSPKGYGMGLETHLLYSNYSKWGEQPNHFDHLRKVGTNTRVRNICWQVLQRARRV